MPFIYAAIAAIVVFLAVVIIRAAMFKPKATVPRTGEKLDVDSDIMAEHLAAMIRCKTVSSRNKEQVDIAEFEKFRALLKELYPNIHNACAFELIGEGGLLYKYKGKSDKAPTVLMSHYDVVPAKLEDGWSKPPFDGIIENGILYGRGTLDTKGTLLGVMEAAEALIGQGFVPQNDIYFSFGGNEEIAGEDAPAIVKALKERGITPALVVDEGGAVVDNVFPGVTKPCALIGVGEKGIADLELIAYSTGGHSSTPPKMTPVSRIARAVVSVERKPFRAHLSAPIAEMLETLGRESSFTYKLLFANLWCFKGLVAKLFSMLGGEMAAMTRTTMAFTMASGANAANVIPPKATAVVNMRLMLKDDLDSVVKHIKDSAGEDIEVRTIVGNNASPYSPTSSEGWERLKSAIGETFGGCVISPYLMLGASDSRRFCRICENVLRFSPFEMSKDDRNSIHAVDEKVSVEKLGRCVEFYQRLILRS